MKYWGAFLSLFVFTSLFAQEPKVRMRLDLPKAGLQVQELPENLDISGVIPEEGSIEFIGSKTYLELLKDEGYPVEFLELQPQSLDSRYLNPQEIVRLANLIAEDYPDITELKVIGHSWEKRPIVALKITNRSLSQPKTRVLFNGMHHAREIMTTEVTADIMIYLTKNYDNPEMPWVRDWVDQLEIWVVPQVNPDGNTIVWSKDTWWRKNARNDGEGGRPWGVDLNRNYPHDWGSCRGSSGRRGSQTYRGEAPGSEPETKALMKLVQKVNPVINISYHSYSELVLAPYGCHNEYTPEDFIFHDVGMNLAKKLVRDSGHGHYRYGTGWEVLYPVDGDDISWMYHQMNVLSYVVEISASAQGFQPDYERWRHPTVRNQRTGWYYLLNRALHGPQIRGFLQDATTGEAIEGSLRLLGPTYESEAPRKTNHGFFTKILKPGEYEFLFEANGYESQILGISVGSDPIEINVPMTRLF